MPKRRSFKAVEECPSLYAPQGKIGKERPCETFDAMRHDTWEIYQIPYHYLVRDLRYNHWDLAVGNNKCCSEETKFLIERQQISRLALLDVKYRKPFFLRNCPSFDGISVECSCCFLWENIYSRSSPWSNGNRLGSQEVDPRVLFFGDPGRSVDLMADGLLILGIDCWPIY